MFAKPPSSQGRARLWLLLALAVFLVGGWLMTHLDGFQWDNDEGILAGVALAVRQGYPLYARVYSDSPPGLALLLAAVFTLVGPNVEAGRAACLALGLAGAVAVALIAAQVVGTAKGSQQDSAALDADPAGSAGLGRAASASFLPLRPIWPVLGGVAAFGLLALSPHFFWISRSINPDVPQMGLGVCGLAALFVYRDRGHRRWLALGALLWAAGMWFKLSGTLLLPPLVLLIVQRHRGSALERSADTAGVMSIPGSASSLWPDGRAQPSFAPGSSSSSRARSAAKGLFNDLVLFGTVAGLALFGWFLVAPAPAMLDNVFGSLIDAGKVYESRALEYASWVIFENLLGENRGLTLLAIVALLGLWRNRRGTAARRANAAVLTLWLATVVTGVILQRPMWPKHHWSYLLWPLATLAGIGITVAVRVAWKTRYPRIIWAAGFQAVLVTMLMVGLLVAWLSTLPNQAAALADKLAPSRYNSARESVAWLEANTPPDAVIVTDTGLIPFRASRRVPPELAVVSSKRNRTGRLTGAQLIAITERDRAAAVVIWNALLTDFDDYKAYLRQRYEKVVDDDGRTIWQRKPD